MGTVKNFLVSCNVSCTMCVVYTFVYNRLSQQYMVCDDMCSVQQLDMDFYVILFSKICAGNAKICDSEIQISRGSGKNKPF